MNSPKRYRMAIHEAGHLAVMYWYHESLDHYELVLFDEPKPLGAPAGVCRGASPLDSGILKIADQHDSYESRVARGLLAGQVAEAMVFRGVQPTRLVCRYYLTDWITESDGGQLRLLMDGLTRADELRLWRDYQRDVVKVLSQDRMKAGIRRVAEELMVDGHLDGKNAESLLRSTGAPQEPLSLMRERLRRLKARKENCFT